MATTAPQTALPYPRRTAIARPLAVPVPVVVEQAGSNCNCQSAGVTGSFEQKIKENPLVFVLGALALGYFLAKK